MNRALFFLLALSFVKFSYTMDGNSKKPVQSELEKNRIALYRLNMIQLFDYLYGQEMSNPLKDLIDVFTSNSAQKGDNKYRDRKLIKRDMFNNFNRFHIYFPNQTQNLHLFEDGKSFDEHRISIAKYKIKLESEIAMQEGKASNVQVNVMEKIWPAPDFFDLVTHQFDIWLKVHNKK